MWIRFITSANKNYPALLLAVVFVACAALACAFLSLSELQNAGFGWYAFVAAVGGIIGSCLVMMASTQGVERVHKTKNHQASAKHSWAT
jgi:membrane associated rhomboid family serine protease